MICFVHIEKAAGTTLNYILRNNYLSFLALPTLGSWTNKFENAFSLTDAKILTSLLPFTRGFGGHTVRPFLEYENVINKQVQYITFLRDPISRYISHYHFQKYILKKNCEIEEFLDEVEFTNFMTKKISGGNDLQKAISILKNKFKFVGLIENFNMSLLLMKNEINLNDFNICYERQREHQSSNNSQIKIIQNDEIVERIRGENNLDIELYNYVKNVLFEKYKRNYGSKDELSKAEMEFNLINDGFKFSKKRMYLWRAYRWIFYRNVYYIVHKFFN
jgi:hypothetical protein